MSKKLLLVAGFLSMLLLMVWLGFVLSKPSRLQPSPSPLDQSGWLGVIPGTTSVEEMVKNLGRPQETRQRNDFNVFLYPSQNQYWQTEVETAQDRIYFIREMVFNEQTDLNLWTAPRTTSSTRLYGDTVDSGFVLIAYPEEGLALVTHERAQKVIEVWYFPKTDLNNFLLLPQTQPYSNKSTVYPEDF